MNPKRVPLLTGDDLAYATLDYIREHPEEWDQRFYFCESQACFAGRAIILAGGKKLIGTDWEFFEDGITCLGPTGVVARKLLGWTKTQAREVFTRCQSKDFTELETRVKQVLNREIQ